MSPVEALRRWAGPERRSERESSINGSIPTARYSSASRPEREGADAQEPRTGTSGACLAPDARTCQWRTIERAARVLSAPPESAARSVTRKRPGEFNRGSSLHVLWNVPQPITLTEKCRVYGSAFAF